MLNNKISRALLSVIIDKKAREKLDSTSKNFSDNRNIAKKNSCSDSRKNEDRSKSDIPISKKKTISRSELIKHAMSVYRSKQYIIEALPKEQKEKLMFMALKIFGENKSKSKFD